MSPGRPSPEALDVARALARWLAAEEAAGAPAPAPRAGEGDRPAAEGARTPLEA